MRLLLTDGTGLLGEALQRALTSLHDVRLLDPAGGRGDPRLVDERDAGTFDTVIHRVEAPPAAPESDIEAIDRATRGLYNLLTRLQPKRFILISSLRPFERYPARWLVTERWAPRPTTDVADLAPFLAEATAREVTRAIPTTAIALRIGEVVGDGAIRDGARDPRWLHVADAVQAVERALVLPIDNAGIEPRWFAFHVVGGGTGSRFPLALASQPPLSFAPARDVTPAHLPADLAAVDDLSAPPPMPVGTNATGRRVLILGAGGPLGAAAAAALAPDHQLRLTDVRPLAEIVAQGTPQSPGAPLPKLWPPPHEHLTVDVTDAGQTAAAMDGIDIVVNCTVVRPDPIAAFLVNTIGAYNVARAAVDRGLRRIVHTGPEQALLAHPAGYAADVDLSEDIPPRPGDNLYFVSKFLGQEICRIFAAEHALEIPALFYSTLVDPDVSPRAPFGIHPLAISWRDAGEAIRAAVTVGSLPRPYEPFHIGVDLPHGRYRVAKASALLHWQPRDRLERHWQRAGE